MKVSLRHSIQSFLVFILFPDIKICSVLGNDLIATNYNYSLDCDWNSCVTNQQHFSDNNTSKHPSIVHENDYYSNYLPRPVNDIRINWTPVKYNWDKLKQSNIQQLKQINKYKKSKQEARFHFKPKMNQNRKKVQESHHEEECDGYENFIKDLEIISFELGIIGFIKATVAWVLHVINQAYIFYSIYLVGLPERLTTVLEMIFPETIPAQFVTIVTVLGLIDYVVIKLASWPIGNLIVIIDFFAEIITVLSLILAFLTIFDEVVRNKVWTVFGIDLKQKLEGYGCNNPFDKEKYVQEWVEMIG